MFDRIGKKATMKAQTRIAVPEFEIDEKQRRDRDDRRHLQDHREGIERALDQPRLREDDGDEDTAERREQKRDRHGAQGDEKRERERAPILDEGRDDDARRGQDVGRDVVDPHHELPQPDREGESHDRQDDADEARPRDAAAPAAAQRGSGRLGLIVRRGDAGELEAHR